MTFRLYLKGDGTDVVEFYNHFNYIWLDYFKVKFVSSDNVAQPGDKRIEAEDGKRLGKAEVWSDLKASNGEFVVELNRSDDVSNPFPNRVRFDQSLLNISKKGSYAVTVGYSSGAAGVLGIDVNGKQERFSFRNTGSLNNWDYTPGTIRFYLYLKGDGTDVLEFYNYYNYIWLDFFYLEFVSDQEIPNRSTDGRIEAESGEFSGLADVHVEAEASDLQVVTGLNASANNINRVSFNDIPADKPGIYELAVIYSSILNGTLRAYVNGVSMDIPWTESDSTHSWLFVSKTVKIDIPLRGDGTDTIAFTIKNANEYIWLDYFTVTYKSDIVQPDPLRANTLIPVSEAIAFGEADIGGAKATHLNSESNGVNFENSAYIPTGTSYISYSNISAQAGYYQLRLNGGPDDYAFSQGWPSRFVVTVNGKASVYTTKQRGFTEPHIFKLDGNGTDTIKIEEFTGGNYTFGYISGIMLSPVDISYFAEAEDASSVSGTIRRCTDTITDTSVYERTYNSSGMGNVDNMRIGSTPTDGLKFNTVTVDSAGEYVMNIRFAGDLAGDPGTFNIIVNGGAPVEASHFSGNWERFDTMQVRVNLVAGNNTIQLKYGSNTWAVVDYIYLSKGEKMVEFEDTNFVSLQTPKAADSSPYASGGQVLNNINGNMVTLSNLPVTKAGKYELTFGLIYTSTPITLNVNGTNVTLPVSQYGTNRATMTRCFPGVTVELKGDGTDVITINVQTWSHYDYVNFRYIGDDSFLY